MSVCSSCNGRGVIVRGSGVDCCFCRRINKFKPRLRREKEDDE